VRRCTSLYIVAELEARLRAATAAQICGAQACAPQLGCCSCCMNSQACGFMHSARNSNKFCCLWLLYRGEQHMLVCTSLYAPAAASLQRSQACERCIFHPFAWIVRTSLYARSFHAAQAEDLHFAAYMLRTSLCTAAALLQSGDVQACTSSRSLCCGHYFQNCTSLYKFCVTLLPLLRLTSL
jgi:hypothetical protein